MHLIVTDNPNMPQTHLGTPALGQSRAKCPNSAQLLQRICALLGRGGKGGGGGGGGIDAADCC